jgi:hypothetical protein
MKRFPITGRSLALLAALGLSQGANLRAQVPGVDPGLAAPAPSAVPVVPGNPLVPYGVPQPVGPASPMVPAPPGSVVIENGAGAPVPVPGYTSPAATTYSNYKQIPVFIPPSARSGVDPKDKTKGENLLEAYYAPKFPNTLPLHGTNGPAWGPGGHVASGMRVGQPYNWSRGGYPGSGPAAGLALASGGGAGAVYGPMPVDYGAGEVAHGPVAYGAPAGGSGCGCNRGRHAGAVSGPVGYGAAGYGPVAYGPAGYGAAGYGAGVGDPGASVNAAFGGGAGAFSSNPHEYHFGPGFHRHSDHAHYRFPYYSYRAPWYHPGPASYNRDTNYPW